MQTRPPARKESLMPKLVKQCVQWTTCLALAAIAALPAGNALAQTGTPTFPTKPLRVLVPFAAGGGTDLMARVIAQKLSEALGQPVLVENRPGGDTIVAADILAKSPPDGYTMLVTLDITLTTNPHLYAKLPYDPNKDFAPISIVAISDLLVVAAAKTPFNDVAGLVSYARANPTKLNYGSGATIAQIAAELLKQAAGTEMVFIPYKGAAPTLTALLAGDIDLGIADFYSFLPAIKQGKIKAIAVTGTARDPSLPDVRTTGEQGYPSVTLSSWWVMLGSAGTPASIIDRLNREVVRIVQSKDFGERMAALSIRPMGTSVAETIARQKADYERWGPVIKAAGIKVQ